MDRFNKLSRVMKTSLVELQKAIRGLVVMSAELEGVYTSMLSNQVSPRLGLTSHPPQRRVAGNARARPTQGH